MTSPSDDTSYDASAEIWDWRREGHSRATGPSATSLRRRGSLQGLMTFGAAAVLGFFGFRTASLIAAVIGGSVLIAALVSPTGVFAAMQRAMEWLAERVAALLNWVLLGGIFYAFFVPFGVLFRRGKRDSLNRSLDSEAATYWVDRDPNDASSRSRQY